MTGSPEQETAVIAKTTILESTSTTHGAPTSPAQSDNSSDSEGRPVREKLKETRIDAQAASVSVPASNQFTNDASNGSAKAADHSTSGSDSDHGRSQRKRSRERYEEENDTDKLPGRKPEVERHARKRSRDITNDTNARTAAKSASSTVTPIEENDVDEQMTSPRKDTATTFTSNNATHADTSPKNKRTHDQVENDTETSDEISKQAPANGKPVGSTDDERDSKRLRDVAEIQSTSETAAHTAKIPPPSSGFANTSTESPFNALSPKPQAPKTSDKDESLPSTSNEKFKSSGFGAFSSSTASPFGAFASSKPSSSSPFAASSGSKLSSFAGSTGTTTTTTTTTGSGFGGFGGAVKSGFGGSSFGGTLGGGFGGLGGAKPGKSSFGTPGDLEIKGLNAKKDKPFGAAAVGEVSDEEDGDDSDDEKENTEEERKSSQPLLSQQAHETGEEGEITAWAGRAKLYSMSGDAGARAWRERGAGPFRFNITVDEPKRARFVLRADGTHRLLLNAGITKTTVFGGDAQGAKPKDQRLLFNSPTADGKLEMHLLKLKHENAVKLWEEVTKVQEQEL